MQKPPYISLLIIICLSTLLNISALRQGHSWADDSALYLAQAKSLIEGKTAELLAQNSYAMAHSTFRIGPDLAPWGLPIILSPIYAIFGLNFLLMKIAGIVLFELSLLVLFYMFLGKLDTTLILLAVAFFAFHPFILLVNDHINSDIPFLLFSLLSIFMIERIIIENKMSNHRLGGLMLIGFFIFSSYLIRFIGIVLIPLLFITQIVVAFHMYRGDSLKYLIHDKLFFIPYVTFAFFELVTYILLPSGFSSYVSFLSSPTLSSIRDLLKYYINITSEFFGPYYSLIIYGTTIPFVALGIYRTFSISYVYLVYPVLTLAILVSVPFIQGIRYLLPIFPFFIYFLCAGLQNTQSQFSMTLKSFTLRIKPASVYMSIIIVLLFMYSVQDVYVNFKHNRITDGPFKEDSLKMLDFISDHTNKTDIIIFFKPRFVTLLTGRQSLMISNFSQMIKSVGSYVVIYRPAGSYNQIAPVSQEFAQITARFPKVFENGDFTIFQLKGLAAAQ